MALRMLRLAMLRPAHRPAGLPRLSDRYSVFSLARHALSPDKPWPRAWRSPEPKSSYDVIIVGGGGHGLATAYYLAANHGITNVAVSSAAISVPAMSAATPR